MTDLNLAIRLTTTGAGKVKAEVLGIEGAVDKTAKTAQRSTPIVDGFGRVLAGLFTAATITAAINATKEYERLGAVMKTLTGDANTARIELDKIKEFAATTPFTLQQVIEAFARLQSVGLNPSQEALRSYGNTAAAMGRDIMQFVEAVADATTGEFERLKDFGIKASAEGEKIRFTFRGITTEIQKDADSIESYLRTIGDTDFSSGMADQMNTLGGAFSNLKDELFNLSAALGDSGFSAALIGAVRWVTDLAKALRTELIPAFSFLTERIGLFRNEVKRLTDEEISARLILLDDQIQEFEAQIRVTQGLRGRNLAAAQNANARISEQLAELRLRSAELEQELNERKNAPLLPDPSTAGTAGDLGTSAARQSKDAFEKWRQELTLDAEATELLHRQISELDRLLFSGDITESQHLRELEKLTGAAEEYRAEIQKIPDEWDRALDLINEEFRRLDEAEARAIAGIEDIRDEGVDKFGELEAAVRGWGKEFTDTLTDMVTKGKADFKDLADSIIRDIIRIQIQKRITDPLIKAGTGILDDIIGGLFHGGGIVGQGSSYVSAPALAFAGAPRYHTGGMAGEVPAILRRGEEVLTESDPRHRNNAGRTPIKVVVENKGQPIEATDAGATLEPDGIVVRVVTQDIQRGGPMSSAFQRVFGLNRQGY